MTGKEDDKDSLVDAIFIQLSYWVLRDCGNDLVHFSAKNCKK